MPLVPGIGGIYMGEAHPVTNKQDHIPGPDGILCDDVIAGLTGRKRNEQ